MTATNPRPPRPARTLRRAPRPPTRARTLRHLVLSRPPPRSPDRTHPTGQPVYGASGLPRWHCHACGADGTAIDLVMLTHGGNVKDALTTLAARTGISPNPIGLPRRPRPRPPLTPSRPHPLANPTAASTSTSKPAPGPSGNRPAEASSSTSTPAASPTRSSSATGSAPTPAPKSWPATPAYPPEAPAQCFRSWIAGARRCTARPATCTPSGPGAATTTPPPRWPPTPPRPPAPARRDAPATTGRGL